MDRRSREGRALIYRKVEEQELGRNVQQVVYAKKTHASPSKPKIVQMRVVATPGEVKEVVKRFGGLEISTPENYSMRYSKHGNFYAIKEVIQQVPMVSSTRRIAFYSESEQMLWTREYEVPYDASETSFFISDEDGSVVEVDPNNLIVTFFDGTGERMRELKIAELLSKYTLEHWKGLFGQFTDDGKYFIANDIYDVYGLEGASNRSSIFLFSKNGQMLWRFEAEEPSSGRKIWPSRDGSYILNTHFDVRSRITVKSSTYLLGKNGSLIKRYDNINLSEADYSETQEKALLCDGRQVFLIECKTGEILMRYGSKTGILGVDLSDELGVVAVLEGNLIPEKSSDKMGKLNNGRLLVLNYDRIPAWEEELPQVEEEGSIGTYLSMSGNGESIGMRIGKAFMQFELEK
jgi:hypothetical protein